MKISKILKWYLLITSIYLVSDGLIHILGVKLINVQLWSKPAFIYSNLITHLYGAFAILAGLFGIETSRDIYKYRNFLYIVAFWVLGYGIYLIYVATTISFKLIFVESPSVFVWMPFYNYYLVFEAGLCFGLSTLIYLFRKKQN